MLSAMDHDKPKTWYATRSGNPKALFLVFSRRVVAIEGVIVIALEVLIAVPLAYALTRPLEVLRQGVEAEDSAMQIYRDNLPTWTLPAAVFYLVLAIYLAKLAAKHSVHISDYERSNSS